MALKSVYKDNSAEWTPRDDIKACMDFSWESIGWEI